MPKSKKIKQNRSKTVKADEVVDFGIFKIARYDNILQFIPTKTPEQHEQLMQAFAEEYPKIIKDIKLLVIEIRELITSFNPLQLLQCCYYKAGMILVHDINKEISSPVNFTNEENTLLKMLSYSHMISKEKIKMSFNSFSDQIDNYYQKIISKDKEHRVEKPSQGIPDRIQELINAANYTSEKHCINAISSILNNDGNQRIDFGQKIDYCLKKQRNTNTILPFYANDFTLICIQKGVNYNNINEIDKLRYSNLYIMDSDSAIGIDAYYDSNDKLYDIKFRGYKKKDLNPSQLNEIYKYIEYQKEKRTNNYLIKNNIKKIGRNESCPCGSGNKYKRCCGKS